MDNLINVLKLFGLSDKEIEMLFNSIEEENESKKCNGNGSCGSCRVKKENTEKNSAKENIREKPKKQICSDEDVEKTFNNLFKEALYNKVSLKDIEHLLMPIIGCCEIIKSYEREDNKSIRKEYIYEYNGQKIKLSIVERIVESKSNDIEFERFSIAENINDNLKIVEVVESEGGREASIMIKMERKSTF